MAKWSHIYRHFKFQSAYSSEEFALAGLLHPFISIHNMTFDIYEDGMEGEGKELYVTQMSASLWGWLAAPVGESQIPLISLHVYDSFSTLFFEQPSQSEPILLSSLKGPFSETVAVLLMCRLSMRLQLQKFRPNIHDFLRPWDHLQPTFILVFKFLH